MLILWTALVLEAKIINGCPDGVAFFLQNLSEMSFATTDAFKHFECFIEFNAILLRHFFKLFDQSLELALLVRHARRGTLEWLQVALTLLLQECLLHGIVHLFAFNCDDFKF